MKPRNSKCNNSRKPRNSGKPNYKKDSETKKYKRDDEYNPDDAKLSAKGRDNNPNWYFLDKTVAEQCSQLSFQQLAGLPFSENWGEARITNIFVRYWNPSPGVQLAADYGVAGLAQKAAINLAGFRLFQKLSAFTGRTQTYGPQDISVMILYMGEIISIVEYIRRVFGVAFIGSERNRSLPIDLIRSMGIDPNDFYTNYAQYRMEFNKQITRLNQVPIPASCAYFDKCASMYEKVYIDSPSPMATILVDVPATRWSLDETSNPRGSMLKTETWCIDKGDGHVIKGVQLSWHLTILSLMVDDLMQSSTFNVIYTDLLNLATKMKTDFWKFDYLDEGYVVFPEYNENYIMQLHNCTFTGRPTYVDDGSVSYGATNANDVVPNPSGNALFYNPGFQSWLDNTLQAQFSALPDDAILDLPDANPTVETRIEMTRQVSLDGTASVSVTEGGTTTYWSVDCVLPDHYCVGWAPLINGKWASSYGYNADGRFSSKISASNYAWLYLISKIDWHPFVYNAVRNSVTDGTFLGDTNFYTAVDQSWLRRLHDFVGLALYDIR